MQLSGGWRPLTLTLNRKKRIFSAYFVSCPNSMGKQNGVGILGGDEGRIAVFKREGSAFSGWNGARGLAPGEKDSRRRGRLRQPAAASTPGERLPRGRAMPGQQKRRWRDQLASGGLR